MPLHCPHCGIAQAEGDGICINCGRPLRPAPAAPRSAPPADPAPVTDGAAAAPESAPPVQERRSSWRLPALLAAVLLLALAASALFVARRGPGRRSVPAAAAIPAPKPPAVAPPAPSSAPALPVTSVPSPTPAPRTKAPAEDAASAAPLTITLASTRDGRHVKVGEGVTLTAFISSAHAQGATLTLFSRHGRGPRTIVSFAQGSLCSTTWTPPAPGRYEFTAAALDHHQQAVSRRVSVTVDAPPAPLTAAREEAPPETAARVVAPPRPRAETRAESRAA